MAKVFNGRLSIEMELEIRLLEKRCRVGRVPRRVFLYKTHIFPNHFKDLFRNERDLRKTRFPVLWRRREPVPRCLSYLALKQQYNVTS